MRDDFRPNKYELNASELESERDVAEESQQCRDTPGIARVVRLNDRIHLAGQEAYRKQRHAFRGVSSPTRN